MPGAPSIATLTLNPAVDQICQVASVEQGVKIRASEARFEPGGGGINVARALDALDVPASALWSKGAETGQLLARLLDEDGIGHRPVPVREATRMNLVAFRSGPADTRSWHFDMPGPGLGGDEVERWVQRVDELEASYVVLSGRRPPDGGEVYARLAHRSKRVSKVVLDTSGPGLARTLEEGVFLVKPNRSELAELTGKEFASEAEIEAAARDIVAVGMAEIVVVSLGSQGALAVSGEGTVRVPAPEVRALSNVGAGDSMVAGLTCHLARGADLEQAVRYGVAAGADAVRRPGTELCTQAGVEELVDALPHRHQP